MEELMAEAVAALSGQVVTPAKITENPGNPGNPAVAEALDALAGQIVTAPSKIPEGKTVVAVELERDPEKSGKFITAIDPKWFVTGRAVAIRDGHIVASNYVFGRYTNGIPKVSAMHYVECRKCGKRITMPQAVWEAKDAARKQGTEIPKETAGMAVLRDYGHCSCGGRWVINAEAEKADLTAFADKALKAISESQSPVPAFVRPQAFVVTPLVGEPKLIEGWEWLTAAMQRAGKAVAPFSTAVKGDAVVFNPGFWLGWVDNPHDTELFWVEGGKAKAATRAPRFNPAAVDGL